MMDRRRFMTAAVAAGGAGLSGLAFGQSQQTGKGEPDPTFGLSQFTNEVLYTVDYQERDEAIINYGNYELSLFPGLRFRGPALDLTSQSGYITCIGAAQTHGVFVDNPYPQLLSQKYGLPVWNLGVGGGHPGFFLKHPKLFEYINKSKFVVLQVMTGRCSENERMSTSPYSAAAYDNKYKEHVSASVIWRRILKEEPENLAKYTNQSRESWKSDLRKLISKINVPIVHFWFSPKPIKPQSYFLNHSNSDAKSSSKTQTAQARMEGIDEYPQFVFKEELKDIENDLFTTCFSNRNQKFALRDKYSGEIVNLNWGKIRHKIDFEWYTTHNTYYPSPEMNWDAAIELSKVIDKHNLTG